MRSEDRLLAYRVPHPLPRYDREVVEPDNPYLHLLDEVDDRETADPVDVRLGLAVPDHFRWTQKA